ncbi:hypothetical protein ACJX0J_010125, partial [Zea mays]
MERYIAHIVYVDAGITTFLQLFFYIFHHTINLQTSCMCFTIAIFLLLIKVVRGSLDQLIYQLSLNIGLVTLNTEHLSALGNHKQNSEYFCLKYENNINLNHDCIIPGAYESFYLFFNMNGQVPKNEHLMILLLVSDIGQGQLDMLRSPFFLSTFFPNL